MSPRLLAILIVRATAVVLAFAGLRDLCVIPFRDNLVLRDVERRSSAAQSLDPQRTASIAHTNLHKLDQARSRRLDPAWYLLYGANCELLERWPEAADAYTRALQIDDRPEIYVNRGMVMLHMGRPDAAVADLATAARFDPNVLNEVDGEFRARVAAAAGLR